MADTTGRDYLDERYGNDTMGDLLAVVAEQDREINKMARHIGKTNGEFAVVVTFETGIEEYMRAWVDVGEAVEAFRHYTDPQIPVQRLGFIKRVIITDGGDCTCMEWIQGKGVVFPTLAQLAEAEANAKADELDKQEQADWDMNEEERSFCKDL